MDARETLYNQNELPEMVTRPLHVSYGVGRWNAGQIMIHDHEYSGSDGFETVQLCTTEVTVEIPKEQDIKGKMLKVLEAEKSALHARHHQELKAVQEKIDSLLTITYAPEAA